MLGSEQIWPVILCGGAGTRLWPASRRSFPKQFAQLIDQTSLFQRAAELSDGNGFAAPTVVTGEAFRFVIREQLEALGKQPASILLEPQGRNTAPAVLAAALAISSQAADALILVMPSDHLIPDGTAFRQAVQQAAPAAQAGQLVTFGIQPTRPETGYGYLELADASGVVSTSPQTLVRFVEKPDELTAVTMLSTNRYLWNAGIFLFRADALIAAFDRHAPEILAAVRDAYNTAKMDLGFTRLDPDSWARAPSISIDYAIMEKHDALAVMPYAAGWSDLGDWQSVWRASAPDSAGNVCLGSATAIDCKGSLLRSENPDVELVGVGLEDMVAIATGDAVLIAPKSASQQVGRAVAVLKAKGAAQAEANARDLRPWGWFESIAQGDRFQVKRIMVKPGASMSLQSHHHRSEHWIIVAGTAQVTVENQIHLLSENQSIYIPLGAKHRLENTGKLPVILIEVQTGAYLGEDDITRYADQYARN